MKNIPETYAYVKGRIVPENEAVISISERGFRLGDGVFETMRVAGGSIYARDLHLARLKQGLTALKINAGQEWETLPATIEQVITKNTMTDGIVRVSISRGIGSYGYLPFEATTPTCVIQVMPGLSGRVEPIDLWYAPAIQSSGIAYKSMQAMPYIMARMEAHEQGCFEALLLSKDGQIAETSSANIFWVRHNRLYTPSLAVGIVDGVMRRRVMAVSPYPVEEGHYTMEDIYGADEVFITNVAWLIVPVKAILGEAVKQSFKTAGSVTEAVLKQIESDMHS